MAELLRPTGRSSDDERFSFVDVNILVTIAVSLTPRPAKST